MTNTNTPNRLSINTNYELLVIEVTGPKQITKSKYLGVPFFVWKVYFHDRTKKLYVGEYVQANKDTQEKFVEGKVVKFHVTTTAGLADEIEEGHILPSAPTNTTNNQNPGIRPALSASGQTYTFAMGYAKDIYCAMIAAGKVEDPAGMDGMDILIGMAKRVNDGLLEMQQEQLNRQ